MSHTDFRFDLCCFHSFVMLSWTTWKHTLCLLGELSPPQPSTCYLVFCIHTHKHTHMHMHTCTLTPLPRLPFFNLLPFHTHSNTHTQCFVLSYLSNTPDLFQHDSDFSLPFILLHCFCYWVDVGEGRSYECQRVCLGDISHCLLFRIKRELGEWSNTFLSWERQSVFRTPTEADKKKRKRDEERDRKWAKEKRR